MNQPKDLKAKKTPQSRGLAFSGFRRCRLHGNEFALVRSPGEKLNVAVRGGKERVVATAADVGARMKLGAPLPNDDVSRRDELPAVLLDAKPFRLRIATVSGAAARFLVCHFLLPVS